MLTRTRIFVAHDHALIREGLKRIIEQQAALELAGEAEGGREASEQLAATRPDLAIIDAAGSPLDGAQTTRLFRRIWPGVKIIALGPQEDRSALRAIFEAGASAYVATRAGVDELLHAIRTVSAGGIYVDPRLAGAVVNSFLQTAPTVHDSGVTLTHREARVLRQIAQGYSNKEIAAELDLSVKTVETYKARAMQKLALRDRVDIVRYGVKLGWLREH